MQDYCNRMVTGDVGNSIVNLLSVVVRGQDVRLFFKTLECADVNWMQLGLYECAEPESFDITVSNPYDADIALRNHEHSNINAGSLAQAVHNVWKYHGGVDSLVPANTWYCQECQLWHVSVDWFALVPADALLIVQEMVYGGFIEGLPALVKEN